VVGPRGGVPARRADRRRPFLVPRQDKHRDPFGQSRAGNDGDGLAVDARWRRPTDRHRGAGAQSSWSVGPVGDHEMGCNATAVAPVWDMYAGAGAVQDFATDMHVQQTYTTTGTLWIDGRAYPLSGVGFKDHSSGKRDFGAWSGHRFLIAVMPDWSLHAVTITRDRDVLASMGAVMVGGESIAVTQFDAAPLEDAEGTTKIQEVVVTGPAGPVSMRIELLHALPITISDSNDNYNGVDWEYPGEPMVMVEGIVQLTDPNGAVGYGFLERSARQSRLPRPSNVDAG